MKKTKKLKYPLGTIYFYLTEGCNLRCCHCWINPKYQAKDKSYPSLDLNLIKSIIEQAKPLGLRNVKLTGGEPLLHSNIKEILEIIKIENIRLFIETNGILCTSELARAMAACKNPIIAVSLDGANAEINDKIRGVKGSFKGACKGIKNLVKAGIKPEVIMTLMSYNKNQIEPLIDLAESLGCGTVKFNILQPVARGKIIHEAGKAISIKELINLGKWIRNNFSNKNLQIFYDQPIAFSPLSQIFTDGFIGCCKIFNTLGVLANGSYALCGIGENVPDLVFGHSAKDNLKEIWNHNKVLQKMRKGLPNLLKGICSKCVMKEVCLGKCIAQNYYCTKDLFAPFWYCEEAYDKGLFPKTRIINPK